MGEVENEIRADERARVLRMLASQLLAAAVGLVDPNSRLHVPRLTEREREVLDGLAAGRNGPEIAGALFVSEHTVKTHTAKVMRKLGARSRAHAVALAYECGLFSPAYLAANGGGDA